MVSILHDGMANMEATVSFLIIDTLALVLRVISRIHTRNTTTTGQFIRTDDWWILAAYLMYASHCIVIVCDITKLAGSLEPYLIMDPNHRLKMLELLWIGSIHFPFVITAVKISILLSGFSTANEWMMIEEGSAILGACVPTFRPIIKKYFKLPKSINDWFSSISAPSVSASKFSNGHLHNKPQPNQQKNQHGSSFPLKRLSTAHIKGGRERRNQNHDYDGDSDDSPLVDNKIWVTRHVTRHVTQTR